ncbi:ATP-binding protein [Paracoccus sp. Ld10]|uniref:ATP-binding protein n=1 Tax=Paracoccus sp. Ld10 TaxID=649158 RepID=UPI003866282C
MVTDLYHQDRPTGRLLSVLDVTDLIAERRHAVRLLLIGNGLATILLASGGFLFVRRMVRPLRQLADRMTAMQGRPQAFPDDRMPHGDPELSALLRTYNRMSAEVQARVEAERRLAERERFVSLGRLSSSLAHEVNNPLGGLLNATDTIRTYAHRPDVVRESSDLVERGLRHLRDVVRVTLDQHRSDTGHRPLTPEDFDDLRLLFQPEASRMDQRLEWRIDADADGLRGFPAGPVRQIALNLLLNAANAAGPGGRIGLTAVAGQCLTLTVSDNGAGLSQDARDRLKGDRPLPPGGGLGLRMIRDLCRDLHGTITDDRQDGMTRISVTLPRMAPS